jgi:uncharacterized membrane protein (UPF0127 family)
MPLDRAILQTATGTHVVGVKSASTLAEQQRGLQFLDSLPEATGMLFLYRRPREVTMWMKHTRFPLDMVFILPGGAVHRVEQSAEPYSERIIASRGSVIAVLEIAAGSAERLGLRRGDRVMHPALGADPA